MDARTAGGMGWIGTTTIVSAGIITRGEGKMHEKRGLLCQNKKKKTTGLLFPLVPKRPSSEVEALHPVMNGKEDFLLRRV